MWHSATFVDDFRVTAALCVLRRFAFCGAAGHDGSRFVFRRPMIVACLRFARAALVRFDGECEAAGDAIQQACAAAAAAAAALLWAQVFGVSEPQSQPPRLVLTPDVVAVGAAVLPRAQCSGSADAGACKCRTRECPPPSRHNAAVLCLPPDLAFHGFAAGLCC